MIDSTTILIQLLMEGNRLTSPPRTDKMSTAELKKALEKIKQTQLEVLQALKNEPMDAVPHNLNESKANENVQGNGTYQKSISHLNLLKMTEVNNMKKQFERERERFQDKVTTLQQRIKLLEGELELKNRMEVQWNNQRAVLNSKIKELQQTKIQNKNIQSSQTLIKAEVNSYREQLTQKIKGKIMMQSEISALHARIKEVNEENQMYKGKYERFLKQTLDKQKSKMGKNMKMSQHIEKNKVPFDDMMIEVRKLAQNHQKVYQSLKTRARIAITDLDVEEQMQQSFTKLLSLIENCQKSLSEERKIIELEDSMIQGVKGFESESFRDEVKRFDKELFDHDNLRREIYDLKTEILALKERKNATELELLKTREQLSACEQKDKGKVSSNSEYESLINELENEMRKIRQQKSMLSSLVKKISQNAFRSSDDQFTIKLKQQLANIMDMNAKMRAENDQYKLTIDGLNITIENMKYEQEKAQTHFEKQFKQKQLIVDQRNKLEKDLSQKDALLLRNQQKINELSFFIQNNSKKYEADTNLKLNENNALRQQIEKSMKELRNLREVAYNYQLLSAENQTLKRKLVQVNSTIIHLWQVKEAEYGNIYAILNDVKKQ